MKDGICVEDIAKSFNDVPLLYKVSFHLAKGEMIALMGKSGSGKSTILNILSGILTPDSGQIKGLENRRITYLFAENHLIQHRGGILNLLLSMQIPDTAQAEDLLTKLGFSSGEFQRPVSQLSFGMARRVAIARAMAHDGEIHLYDEPVYGLDSITKELVLTQLEEYLQGKTGILVTHEMDVAKRLTSRILTMDEINHIAK